MISFFRNINHKIYKYFGTEKNLVENTFNPTLESRVFSFQFIAIWADFEFMIGKFLKIIEKQNKNDYKIKTGVESNLILLEELEKAMYVMKHPNARKIHHLILADFIVAKTIRNSILHRNKVLNHAIKNYAENHEGFIKIIGNHFEIDSTYVKFFTDRVKTFFDLFMFHNGINIFTATDNITFPKSNEIVDIISPKIIILDSRLHNKGMFANEDINKDEIIVQWNKNYFDEITAEKAKSEMKPLIKWDDNLYSYFDNENETSHCINHSCNANSWLADPFTLIAKRDIKKGTEITNDYAQWISDGKYVADWKCNCYDYGCRNYITGKDYQKRIVRGLYQGHFSPAVQTKIKSYLANNGLDS